MFVRSELWAMEPNSFAGLQEFARLWGASGMEVEPRQLNRPAYRLVGGGVAIMQIRGPILKTRSLFNLYELTTPEIRDGIRDAVANVDVKSILFVFDTPGGAVAGASDLANDIAAAGHVKPTAAYLEDLCASAGYWAASQAQYIATNATGLVGCIGAYAEVVDSSGAAKEAGLKVHIIKAGAFKGAGMAGTTVTPSHLTELQRTVNAVNDQFTGAVHRGRKLSMRQLTAVSDGQLFVGRDALTHKLVDAVQSLDATVAHLVGRGSRT